MISCHRRDRHGRLQPDKERFPSGMKALADYVRARSFVANMKTVIPWKRDLNSTILASCISRKQ